MWSEILLMFSNIINFVFNTFTTLFNAIPGAWDTVFTLIVITMVFRFILAPLFSGGSGSDNAKKRKDSESSGD